MDEFTYRLLQKNDLVKILELMEKIKPPIAGLQNRKIYKNFCNYVFKTDRIIFAIAIFDDEIIGFSITIIDHKKFWKSFLIQHKFLFIMVILKKFCQYFSNLKNHKKKESPNDIDKYLSLNSTNRSWKDSSPLIGKVLYVAVAEEFRKRGIGSGLYRYRHQILLNKGVKRVDSKINQMNIAPIKLAFKEGRQIVKEKKGMLFTTLDL